MEYTRWGVGKSITYPPFHQGRLANSLGTSQLLAGDVINEATLLTDHDAIRQTKAGIPLLHVKELGWLLILLRHTISLLLLVTNGLIIVDKGFNVNTL